MKKIIIIVSLVVFTSTSYSQVQNDSDAFSSKKSLTLYLRNTSFEGGVGGTFWLNEKYSFLLIINGSSIGELYGSQNGYVKKSNIYISSIITIRRHIFERINITPFIGVTAQPLWYVGEVSKRTEYDCGIVFGVESWLTENISITGEQSILTTVPINNPADYFDTSGRSSISISFYY